MQRFEQAETIALQVAEFIASSPEELERFMAASGCDAQTLAATLGQRETQVGLLEYLCRDESLLLSFSEMTNIPPESPAKALRILQNFHGAGGMVE